MVYQRTDGKSIKMFYLTCKLTNTIIFRRWFFGWGDKSIFCQHLLQLYPFPSRSIESISLMSLQGEKVKYTIFSHLVCLKA
jgi:hypothetical protein